MKDTVLLLEWNSFGNDFLIRTLENLGYQVDRFLFPRETEDVRLGQALTEKILKKIMQTGPAFVFSFNYFPVAAIACKAARVKYVSWVYDSPFIMLYSQTILYDTNRVFVFDSEEVRRLRQLGVQNVYYMPMAAAVTDYDKCQPSAMHHQKYDSDVTFIGSMYSETHQHMFRHLEALDDYTKGFLYGLMETQKNLYGVDILEPSLMAAPHIVETMQKTCPVEARGDGLETVEWTFANYFLARKVTAMERQEIMKLLSDTVIMQRKRQDSFSKTAFAPWKICLFTPEKTDMFPGISCKGKLDYYSEAPYAIKCAKINLNISLRSIHNGMPLRALDLLGCGGFLMTNYQADFMKHFVPGEDFVYYETIAQIPQLIDYYLTHEEERIAIAKNGYRKVKEEFSYERQLERMLNMI